MVNRKICWRIIIVEIKYLWEMEIQMELQISQSIGRIEMFAWCRFKKWYLLTKQLVHYSTWKTWKTKTSNSFEWITVLACFMPFIWTWHWSKLFAFDLMLTQSYSNFYIFSWQIKWAKPKEKYHHECTNSLNKKKYKKY